ncbi:hypothetical protein DAPPUDRAFT_120511 [Daphnia pulex]|uniref:CxC3 like cysteine cluster domain-containing protein n=1 Tax=Daphnia pulex TaxID=6669 RepID=E9I1L5_DAPPU|nr:hypothetical protein DAPPUDRAFT_120511 [Daphnia pulex]|eukprot:EFX62114.1 hypothetical protein DAPPUDRAFT_120511 [Daphnia pulex]
MRVFVPVSCRTEKCKKLGTKGTLVLVAGTKYCTVISGEGRFDLHCAAFKCSRCDGVMNAELEDYIGSGYWPGNPKTLGIFFTTSFLKLYFHLKNYLPGSSEYGLLKALGAFSADAGRENTISNAFSRASRMYYYITHLADRDIKQQRKQRLLKGVDMTKGETYSHTLLLLEHIYGLQDPEHANLLFKT